MHCPAIGVTPGCGPNIGTPFNPPSVGGGGGLVEPLAAAVPEVAPALADPDPACVPDAACVPEPAGEPATAAVPEEGATEPLAGLAPLEVPLGALTPEV